MIVGFSGFAQTGKDTAAEQFIQNGFVRIAFADALKREVEKMLHTAGVRVDLINNEQDKKDWRDFLVYWGAKRREQSESYWVKRLIFSAASRRLHLDMDNIVIPDVRYKNEVEWIEGHKGLVIRLHRPEHGPKNDEEEKSFQQIDKHCTLPQVNNDGTIEQLKEAVWDLYEH